MTEQVFLRRKTISEMFRKRREWLQISREDLAKRLDIPVVILAMIEAGAMTWEIDLHFRICEELGVD